MKVTIELDTLDISRLSALCNAQATLMWKIANKPTTKHEIEHLYWLANHLQKSVSKLEGVAQ